MERRTSWLLMASRAPGFPVGHEAGDEALRAGEAPAAIQKSIVVLGLGPKPESRSFPP